jgi:hypothetical protein
MAELAIFDLLLYHKVLLAQATHGQQGCIMCCAVPTLPMITCSPAAMPLLSHLMPNVTPADSPLVAPFALAGTARGA